MRKNGFTLIELMIVIAIISVIAAIAIPNLLRSRLRANETVAVTVIKQIATAQILFRHGRLGMLAVNTKAGPNGYCDNYRNLYCGNPIGDNTSTLSLISKAIADASVAPDGVLSGGCAVTNATPQTPDPLMPYNGYCFLDPPGGTAFDFMLTFGVGAVPELSGSTGESSFYVGEDGGVYFLGLATGVSQTLYHDLMGGTSACPFFGLSTAMAAGWKSF